MAEYDIVYKSPVGLKKDDYIMMNDHPCKIVGISCTPFLERKGYRKIHFVGIDIETGQKYEVLHRSNESVSVPLITD